jgi:hypothetical protein
MSRSPAPAPDKTDGKPRLSQRIEAMVLIPNLILVGLVVLYLVSVQAVGRRPGPLVAGKESTKARIAELELLLERQPNNLSKAIELAKLYKDVGEFPWSYNALLTAEQQGDQNPRWRLMLGLAFLEIGKNSDGRRVLERALERCKGHGLCDANVMGKLGIFAKLAQLLHKRGIDTRKHPEAAERTLREILKPVEVDPNKMRPKAPATPQPESKKDKG